MEKKRTLRRNTTAKSPNKKKRKINKVNLWAVIISCIACLGLICVAAGMVVIVGMLKDKPTLDVNDFTNSQSSIIYDRDGNEIAELGTTIRENVSFEDLPNCLVDAFVAVEDSRFFEHNGFDVPRFTKAFLSNLRTLSFSQGGSTFTMQLIKNTYFQKDDTGEMASRSGVSGVTRKVQEIALAMELENSSEINKKIIMELYLNKLNFGGNRNIRGVEKAAEYYFNKSVTELNLAESALLAGVINAPSAYNPYYNLEKATNRRNEVLYQMMYHGYITEEEYQLARSIKVEDLLADGSTRSSSNGVAIPYQAYIDQVVAEVYEITGKDPYTTGMRIYTYMSREVQELMDSIQNGTYERIEFPDEEFELASIAVNNQTGAIVGILGGRNYADGGSLLLNHATDQYKQPGSSIKPILDYVLAFENLGWATDHVLVDKPITYPGTSVIIANSNGKYQGQVVLKDALGNSLNTPAIQTLEAVLDAKGYPYVVDYMNSMGFDIALEDFDVQCGIGGNKLQVSCLQMAGAQGALLNYGNYTKPHTISRIEFLDGKAPITPAYTSTQTVSAEAAYMISTLLNSNVSGGYANLMQVLIDDYPVYAKTGTTDWGNSGVSYGIPVGAIKDAWMIGSTSEYTVATWIGYERAQKDKQSYITLHDYLTNIQGKTTNAILDMTVDVYGRPAVLQEPEGLVSLTHILATFPYAAPIEGMNEQFVTTGLIKREFANLVDPEAAGAVEAMNSDPKISFEKGELTIEWPKYPNEEALHVADQEMDISLKRNDGSIITEWKGTRLFDYSWVYGPIRYKAEIKINNNTVSTVSSETEKNSYKIDAQAGDEVTACAFYAYENAGNSSTQRCVKLSIDDKKITFIIPATSVDDAKDYLENLGATVVVETAIADQYHSVDTFSVFNGTEELNLSEPHEMYQSELNETTFKIVKYIEPQETISLSKTALSVSGNGTCEISATSNNGLLVDVTWTWTVDADDEQGQDTIEYLNVSIYEVPNTVGKLRVDGGGQTKAGTITITARTSNGLTATTTLRITE
ncbi:MAG: transglycosylase domain-containing protein [Erysipelotrichaceae bacterium]|nr:transglycosylase domain-containing protein [Erysipelotrichaceae bacterium]